MSEQSNSIRQLGVQEPPNDAMIYNRRQPDGTFRPLTGFFQREENMTTEEREGETDMLHCRDCGYYRPIGGGLGKCPRSVCPFGGDSEPVCDRFRRPKQILTKLPSEQRDTTTIAGKFAEALGCIEDGLYWLGQVNARYDPQQHDDSRPVLGYSLHRGKPNPVIRFWIEADKASEELKDILRRLQRVEPLAPKEVTA